MTGKNVYLNLFRKNWVYDFSSESFMWHLDSTMEQIQPPISQISSVYGETCQDFLPESGPLSLNLDQTQNFYYSH